MSESSSTSTSTSSTTATVTYPTPRDVFIALAAVDEDGHGFSIYKDQFDEVMAFAKGRLAMDGWHADGKASPVLNWHDNYSEFVAAFDFIYFCLKNRREEKDLVEMGSGGWKHTAECWISVKGNRHSILGGRTNYVSNGAFIAAAIAQSLLPKDEKEWKIEYRSVKIALLSRADRTRFEKNGWLPFHRVEDIVLDDMHVGKPLDDDETLTGEKRDGGKPKRKRAE